MVINLVKNPCTWFTLLWMLYYMQGHLYNSTLIGTGVISLYILVSLYYLFLANRRYKLPAFYKSLTVLVVMFSIYGIVRIIEAEQIYRFGGVLQNPTVYLKNYYISLLPPFTFYVLSKKGHLSLEWLRSFSFIFVLFAIWRYFVLQNEVMESLLTEADGITNNMGYLFVSLMVILPLFRGKDLLQNLMFLLMLVFSVASMKRGAILCALVCGMYYIWTSIKNKRSIGKIKFFLISAIAVSVLYMFTSSLFETNAYFADRIYQTTEGDMSGRNLMYAYFYDTFMHNSHGLDYIFGYGADGTIKLFQNFAHNDWLEIAIDCGLFGIIIYFFYWWNFFKEVRSLKESPMLHSMMILTIIPIFLKSFFSMSITDIQIYQSAIIAFCLTNKDKMYE